MSNISQKMLRYGSKKQIKQNLPRDPRSQDPTFCELWDFGLQIKHLVPNSPKNVLSNGLGLEELIP